MNGRSRYFFGTFGVCSAAGGDVVAIRLDLDFCNLDFRDSEFRDLEYREGLEDREDLEVVMGVVSGDSLDDVEGSLDDVKGSLDDVEGSSEVDSKGDSTVLEGQSIWGLTSSSQGIPKLI